MHRKLIAAACAVVGILGATGVALAVSGGDSADQTPAVAQSVDDRLAEQLSVFRDTPADTIPPKLAAAFTRTIADAARANVALARKVQTDVGPFYLVPGDGEVCQIGGGTMACGDSASLASDPLGYQLYSKTEDIPDGTIIVSGIAADNVRSIRAVQPDGTQVAVRIAENGYATAIPVATTAIELETTDQGVLRTTVPKELSSR